jgi:hypothetical protein
MDLLVGLLLKFLNAGLQLLIHPFYYMSLLFIVLQYRKQIQFERKLFHTRLHSLLDESWRTLLGGWIGGLSASILMIFVGLKLQTDVILLVWVIALLLVMIRVRYLCMAYSVGILGILHVLLLLVPNAVQWSFIGPVFQVIASADLPSLLVIVAVLHLLEGVLTGLQGARMASPLFMEGKRGKIIGGYQLQGFWPVPLFLLVPMQGGHVDVIPWLTLFGTEYASGWSILAFPAMIGFTELTMSRLPREKALWSSRMLLLYGGILFILAVAAHFWSPLILIAAFCSIALHEALLAYSRWDEAKRIPVFVHSQRGLMILAVVPKSPADELGLQAGEIIHKVNGFKITNKTDLHHAMQLNSAFCKLEVVNLQGEIKFVQRALFSGEHHQLGLILAPDQHAMYYVANKPIHLFTYLRKQITGLLTNDAGKPM